MTVEIDEEIALILGTKLAVQPLMNRPKDYIIICNKKHFCVYLNGR
jgi:hypothetical protein